MRKYAGKSLSFDNLLYSKTNWRATVTINRPEVYNCLNLDTLRELSTAFQDAAWDDEVAVIILTGAGNKAFCTGADMKEWSEDFLETPNDFYKWMGEAVARRHHCRPTTAGEGRHRQDSQRLDADIHTVCIGGGCYQCVEVVSPGLMEDA